MITLILKCHLKLKTDSFLSQINTDSWDILSSHWKTYLYKPNQFIFSAGDPNSDVFFVLRGSAKITTYTKSGKEISFATAYPGDSFGEFSVIAATPRSASVIAYTECLIASVSAKRYLDIIQHNPDISFALIYSLVKYIQRLSKRIVDFNEKNSRVRLREILVEIARNISPDSDNVLIESPPTQAKLAALIFTSRESVAREMGSLRKKGILQREKRRLRILSIQKLINLSDID